MRKFVKLLLLLLVLAVVAIYSVDYWVQKATQSQIYTDVANIPKNRVGLLLGTSKYLGNGQLNFFYKYRIDAAVALYKAGKIEYIIVSGDNGTKAYNEPEMMQQDLIANGVAANHIYLDYAGFRTLDSVLRCIHIFDAKQITVISQQFHNERALFIANKKDMQAIAYNAKDVDKSFSLKTRIREKFARCKMMIDLMFNKQAKFYGPKIEIK